jgi:hypothetical protein
LLTGIQKVCLENNFAALHFEWNLVWHIIMPKKVQSLLFALLVKSENAEKSNFVAFLGLFERNYEWTASGFDSRGGIKMKTPKFSMVTTIEFLNA